MDPYGRHFIADEPTLDTAVWRGFRGRCPACGQGCLFGRFLKVVERCPVCGTEFHHHRADDLPPYIVIVIVAHVVGYGIYASETRFETPLWVHLALWPALTLMLALALLQPAKGAVVGLQYALGMHGFGAVRSSAARHRHRQETTGDGHEGAEHHGSTDIDRP